MRLDFKGELERAPIQTIVGVFTFATGLFGGVTFLVAPGLFDARVPTILAGYASGISIGAVCGVIAGRLFQWSRWLGTALALLAMLVAARLAGLVVVGLQVPRPSIDYWLMGAFCGIVFLGVFAERIHKEAGDETEHFPIVGILGFAGFLFFIGVFAPEYVRFTS